MELVERVAESQVLGKEGECAKWDGGRSVPFQLMGLRKKAAARYCVTAAYRKCGSKILGLEFPLRMFYRRKEGAAYLAKIAW